MEQQIEPFGIVLSGYQRIEELACAELAKQVAKHRVVVIRGADAPSQQEMLGYCGGLGQILEWQFGAVNELKASAEAKNYLYTEAAVPYHWDGAFLGKIPHYIFFHCAEAPDPDAGGETIFCDTTLVLAKASQAEKRLWNSTRINYSTDKVVHYGGSFTSPIVSTHPIAGYPVLRYAEEVNDLNPVYLNCDPPENNIVQTQLKAALYDPACMYAHRWISGDIVIADNHTLLHGRNAYRKESPRHLRRVNIL